ncbi:MAG: DNA adenine methylase [Blastochloris sp.]|nr:DNA adenine methylase [Blastochloris sp.]
MRLREHTLDMFYGTPLQAVRPFKTQLLKWIGNKQRFAHEIASFFPKNIRVYREPFFGSGAVLAALQPPRAVASDVFRPLVDIWKTLHDDPETLVSWYHDRFEQYHRLGVPEGYNSIRDSYNAAPNGADLLFLCRSCYGGVVRFRKADGYMSTPCGAHEPISPASFSERVEIWRRRTAGTQFRCCDFSESFHEAEEGDLIYCDPPYTDSQSILYGGQDFALKRLLEEIALVKQRGVRVALSIDGTKKSGSKICDLDIPFDLFEEEVFVNCGRSMLRRFQRGGETLEDEVVSDRLLLTYKRG